MNPAIDEPVCLFCFQYLNVYADIVVRRVCMCVCVPVFMFIMVFAFYIGYHNWGENNFSVSPNTLPSKVFEFHFQLLLSPPLSLYLFIFGVALLLFHRTLFHIWNNFEVSNIIFSFLWHSN